MDKKIDVDSLIQIITEINPGAGYWLQQDPNLGLLESDTIDSINVVAIIKQLETRYQFAFNVSDIKFDHFQSLDSLLKLLYSKYNFVPTS